MVTRKVGTIWIGGLLAAMLAACSQSSVSAPEREGPPALVQHESQPRLWLLLKQEEQRTRSLGGSRRLLGKLVTETSYHFDLQAHDPASAARLWKKRLLTVKEDAGGRVAEARILGQAGAVVWLFLHDGPVALSAADGRQLADRATIERENPALRGLLPSKLDFYLFDRGLVVTAADARRFRIGGADGKAEPYTPPSDDYFRQLQAVAKGSGGYHTRDFLVRQMRLDGRWLGLFSEKEAADAANDEFGDKLATGEPGSKADSVFYESSRARRTFWSARLGKTREFSEGTHDRLFDLARIPGAPEFLEAGLLVQQGTRQVMGVQDPDGFLVLHRTRLDEDGRLALTRLTNDLQPQWMAKLPFHELRHRYQTPQHLLLYGVVQQTRNGVTATGEHLVSLDLADGKTRSWNVGAEELAD